MAERSDTLVTVKSNPSLQNDTEANEEVTDEEQNEKVFCPTLIFESTVEAIPPNLQSIIEGLNTNGGSDKNKHDLLISIFYVLMIEVGFIPNKSLDVFPNISVDFHKGRLLAFNKLPANWKSEESNLYHLEFVLSPFPNRVCKLSCYCVSTNMYVNVKVGAIGNFCAQFRISKYVTGQECDFIPKKFHDLDELSIEFKDQVANIAKAAILKVEGVDQATLQDLPSEILYTIFTKLSVKDFLNTSSTCLRLRECKAYYEHKLWKYYFARDFPSATMLAENNKWLVRYKEETRKKKRSQRFKPRSYYDYGFMDLI